MTPLLQELSSLEVEPIALTGDAPSREGFYTPPQDSSLTTLSVAQGDLDVLSVMKGKGFFNDDANCCCCCILCFCGV